MISVFIIFVLLCRLFKGAERVLRGSVLVFIRLVRFWVLYEIRRRRFASSATFARSYLYVDRGFRIGFKDDDRDLPIVWTVR